jgi:hypothetical protein
MFKLPITIELSGEEVKKLSSELERIDDNLFVADLINQILKKVDRKTQQINAEIKRIISQNPYSQ